MHVAIVVPVFIVFVTGTSSYNCSAEALVKAAIYFTLGLNLAAIAHDATLIVNGWRGGPLEEHKRHRTKFLIFSRLCLYVLTLAALIWSTVLIYLPSITSTCYLGNPCDTSELGLREDACVNGTLVASCQTVYGASLPDIERCRTDWFNLAATFAVNQYDPSTVPPYPGTSFTGTPSNDSSLCDVTYEAVGEPFKQWQNETGQYFPPYNPSISPLDINKNGTNDRTLGLQWAATLGYTDGSESPWNQCLEGSYCYAIVISVQNCPIYNDLLFFGQKSSDYTYALTAVWGSWAIMLINVVIVVAAFNAFPEYDDRQSWKESVKSMARLLCCSSILKHAKTEDGQDAAAGLGDLLFKLFGGIDLDYTDLLFGLYLVSERQAWRRFHYAKGRIENLGKRVFVPRKELRKAAAAAAAAREDRPSDDVEFEGADDDSNALSFRQSMLNTKVKSMAETKTKGPGPAGDSGDAPDSGEPGEGHRMAHVVVSFNSRPFVTPFDFSPLGMFDPPINGRDVSMYVQTSPRGGVGGGVGGGGEGGGEHERGRERSRDHREAIRSCLDLVWFAKAAYGLQTKKWKDAKQDSLMGELGDKCLACTPFLRGPLTESHFTKRNFASILRYTKVAASDVLYVSYTNTALGILPYLVVLDRAANRVVISVRGTTALPDVVTDLLGHPQDATEFMPAWVHDANVNKSRLHVHSGILSSAAAVLRDLDANGILEAPETTVEMAPSIGTSTYGKNPTEGIIQDTEAVDDAIGALGLDDEVELPIERAHSILAEAAKRDVPVVITGHSLGAAVASVCAFRLRSRFPQMRCVCFNPPGGVMSKALSEMSEPFCTSFIVGSDIISRLNLVNMSRLVDDMVLALARCKKPKLTVLFEIIFGRRRFRNNADTYYAADEISDEVLEILQRYIDTSLMHGKDIREDKEANLLPPGKAFFLRPVESLSGKSDRKAADGKPGIGTEHDAENDFAWDVVTVDKETLLDEGILLTADAIDHHHLWLTLSAMMSAMEDSE